VHVLAMLAALVADEAASAQSTSLERYHAVPDTARIRQQPWQRFFTRDSLGRTITFYLSEEPRGTAPLPLVVYVHGSGSQSHFARVDGRIVGRNGHSSFNDVVRGRARLLIVEKPGVAFLDSPRDGGGARYAALDFREEHTLERWTEAVHAAVEAARSLPAIRPGSVLVVGHSEGGIVAARLAADYAWITHVGILAGGGASQLDDLTILAREGVLFADVSSNPDTRVRYVLDAWDDIQRHPARADTLWFGHPYRRWASFLSSTTLGELLRSQSRIYVAQGTDDRAVAWESFDLVRRTLRARQRDAVIDEVADADHSFAVTRNGQVTDGWSAVLRRVTDWFLRAP
jgi:pimeloyl-ACP methyl ester carboxylesterase